MTALLFETGEWDFATLQRTYEAIEEIAIGEMGLDVYPNQIELISAEQMLDAYSSIGLPTFYHHWSFGKRFAMDEAMYRKGYSSLAYEIVINSNPCISYLMEENTMTMQALVTAHAAFGHNHFFKNNYLYRDQTDAGSILDYLSFAKTYISRCEERYGVPAVERILDAAHALMDQGVDRYGGRRSRPRLADEQARVEVRRQHNEDTFNDLWRTLPASASGRSIEPDSTPIDAEARGRGILDLPEENVLYFLEKHSPSLKGWEREIVRIVRNIAQYFLPQGQTKVMNEGCATFVHYKIMHRLHEKGLIADGSLLEFLTSHSSVIFQPDFDDRRFSGFNPYALGFAMMCDIERMATDPTDEDREWFPDLAGSGDAMGALKYAWANFRDDSFIAQYLSPCLMRRMRLFLLEDRQEAEHYTVAAIHNASGYRDVRRALAAQYDPGRMYPNIDVTRANLRGDRRLSLTHHRRDRIPLEEKGALGVLAHVRELWGYDCELVSLDDTDVVQRFTLAGETAAA
jgi:spore cortex formation protein SpoVR/YcgB (stage V sporulation)